MEYTDALEALRDKHVAMEQVKSSAMYAMEEEHQAAVKTVKEEAAAAAKVAEQDIATEPTRTHRVRVR